MIAEDVNRLHRLRAAGRRWSLSFIYPDAVGNKLAALQKRFTARTYSFRAPKFTTSRGSMTLFLVEVKPDTAG